MHPPKVTPYEQRSLDTRLLKSYKSDEKPFEQPVMKPVEQPVEPTPKPYEQRSLKLPGQYEQRSLKSADASPKQYEQRSLRQDTGGPLSPVDARMLEFRLARSEALAKAGEDVNKSLRFELDKATSRLRIVDSLLANEKIKSDIAEQKCFRYTEQLLTVTAQLADTSSRVALCDAKDLEIAELKKRLAGADKAFDQLDSERNKLAYDAIKQKMIKPKSTPLFPLTTTPPSTPVREVELVKVKSTKRTAKLADPSLVNPNFTIDPKSGLYVDNTPVLILEDLPESDLSLTDLRVCWQTNNRHT